MRRDLGVVSYSEFLGVLTDDRLAVFQWKLTVGL